MEAASEAYRKSNFSHVIVDSFNNPLDSAPGIQHIQAALAGIKLSGNEEFRGQARMAYEFLFEGRKFFVFVL